MDYNKTYNIFTERMQSLIRISGRTQKDICADLGIAESTLSRYMNNGKLPDTRYILHLAQHFDVSVDWLLGLNDDRRGTLSPVERELVYKYALASKQDRLVIDTILSKYGKEADGTQDKSDK